MNDDLSALAIALLRDMERDPARAEYNTRVLGSMFRDEGVEKLDHAYAELRQAGLVEPTGSVVSFFGTPKPLYRITEAGEERARKVREAS